MPSVMEGYQPLPMRTAFILICSFFLWSCTGDGVAPDHSYVFQPPSNFPAAAYTFENNPVTKDGFELGRALFYDPILSADSTIACTNCHQQFKSFSDPVHKFSRGVKDASGFRNAPAIQNMAFQTHFFWDGGVSHLDFVPINAITSDIEMAEKLEHVIAKLNRSSVYQEKFKSAFGTTEVNSQKMLFALSQFMNMMISADSRYDHYVRNEGETLTADEVEGMKLFASRCSTCHATDMFTDGTFRNNGLNATFENDAGRARITELAEDRGKFKVPSLRNAELTSPYMHDGRFKTLQEVLDHYAGSVKDSETLDPVLKQTSSPGIPMTEEEKTKIIAYIKTLTDRNFTSDKRFTNPFLN